LLIKKSMDEFYGQKKIGGIGDMERKEGNG
jgi:hypothetical protein